MKRKKLITCLVLGVLSIMLWGCQGTGRDRDELEKPIETTSVFQFVKGHGIVKSKELAYILDADTAPEQSEGNVTITLVDVVQKGRQLIANFIVSDYSKIKELDVETSVRYGEDIIKLIGPDILEENSKPVEAKYIPYPDFYEQQGYMRSFITASFELPSDLDVQKSLPDYKFKVLDFDEPMEFTMKQAPGYQTLEELASAEGSMDTHDGFSVLAVGEVVAEGILVEWYTYSETDQLASIAFTPPGQVPDRPILSSGGKEYPTEHNLLYMDKVGLYQLEGIIPGGHVYNQLFLVPEEEREGVFSLELPGITYLQSEESEEITLRIPGDTEALVEEIPFGKGSVRLDKIAGMAEPQEQQRLDKDGNVIEVIRRPAVYIQVSAASDEKVLNLKRLICKRKKENGLWENQRYDFDEQQNLSGFRVFYDEGDTKIILKFSRPGFYWEQPYRLELEL